MARKRKRRSQRTSPLNSFGTYNGWQCPTCGMQRMGIAKLKPTNRSWRHSAPPTPSTKENAMPKTMDLNMPTEERLLLVAHIIRHKPEADR